MAMDFECVQHLRFFVTFSKLFCSKCQNIYIWFRFYCYLLEDFHYIRPISSLYHTSSLLCRIPLRILSGEHSSSKRRRLTNCSMVWIRPQSHVWRLLVCPSSRVFTRNLTISVRKRINIFPVVRPLFVPGVNDTDVVVPRLMR